MVYFLSRILPPAPHGGPATALTGHLGVAVSLEEAAQCEVEAHSVSTRSPAHVNLLSVPVCLFNKRASFVL